MIINPDKFKAMILYRKKSHRANIPLSIDNQTNKSVPSVKLLRSHLDAKLNFNRHITYLSSNAKSFNQQLHIFKF